MSRSTTNHAGHTRKQVAALINTYLLNCILSPEDLADEYGTICTSDKDRINAVVSGFQSWYSGYEQKRYPSKQEGFAQWLMGLPHVISVDYTHYDILRLAVEWGALPANYTENQGEKITQNWFNYISCKFWKLHAKLNK